MKAKTWTLVVVIALVVVFVITIVAMSASENISGAKIADRSIVVIDLSKNFPEFSRYQFEFFRIASGMTFYRLISSIYAAADDENVDAIVLRGPGIQGLSKTWEIAQALKYFRTKGKPIYGCFDAINTYDFMLLGLCDTVSLAEQGFIVVPGFGAHLLFLRGTFEKLGVGFEVIQYGKYKGAGEQFTNDSMSFWLRESYEKFLDDIFERYVSDCSEWNKMSREDIKAFIDSAFIFCPKAMEFGLVHYKMDWSQFKKHLVGEDKKGEDRIVSINKYSLSKKPWKTEDKKIALVVAEGAIYEQERRFSEGISPDTYAEIFRDLARDKEVDAIVFRVNSPGGSALASDIIHSALVEAAKEKPLYVSMGSVAVSGGYYISMAADTIFATPYCLTGSIGVIMLRPHFGNMYKKIGAKTQTLKRGKFADAFTGDHPMTPDEKALFDKVLGYIYTDFVTKAAAGRDTSYEWIDSVAQGRIWSAQAADSVAIIDTLGSLWDAIVLAEKNIGVPEGKHAKIIIKPRPESIFEFTRKLSETSVLSILPLPKFLREEIEKCEFMNEFVGKPIYLWLDTFYGL